MIQPRRDLEHFSVINEMNGARTYFAVAGFIDNTAAAICHPNKMRLNDSHDDSNRIEKQ